MTTISISKLKINPAAVIREAEEYPVALEKHNSVKAYVVGKEIFEQMLKILEDKADKLAISKTDFSKGKDFEKVASDLGI